jgi:branched-chain amino acid aminotransferase
MAKIALDLICPFSKMESYRLWFDGNWQPESKLPLSENRSFLFGDGFFETIRISQNGSILLADFHWVRIRRTVEALRFPWPDYLDEQVFWSLIFSRFPGVLQTDLRLKILFFRKGSGAYGPESTEAAFFVDVRPLDYPWIRFGNRLGMCHSIFLPVHPYSWIKSASALPYTIAAAECRRREMEDLILCQKDGFVVEGTHSSLFWFSENQIQIPDPELGGLHSCMKEFLLAFWNRKGMPVQKKSLLYAELMQADWLGMANGTGIRIFDLKGTFEAGWLPAFEP